MNSVVVAVAALLVAMVSIQFGASLAVGLFPQFGAAGATFWRLLLAALLLAGLWRPWRFRLSPGQWRPMVVYGAALGAMNFLFYLALARTPLGIAVALEFTGPLVLAVAASRRRLDFLWVLLAVLGIAMMLPRGETGIAGARVATQDLIGMAYALGAGACWALYIVFGKRASAILPGGRAASLGMLVAALTVTPVGALMAGARLWQPALLPAAFGVAVLSSALPYSLELVALRRLPTKTFGILMSVEPAIAALMGLLVLGERLTPGQWFAVAAVIVASAGSAWTSRTDKAAVAPQPP